MAGNELENTGEIIRVANDGPALLRHRATEVDVYAPGEKPTSVYLGTDVSINRFGVASFGLVVSRPGKRPIMYADGSGGPYSPDTLFADDRDVPGSARRAHYIDTDQGFAVARVVSAPKEVHVGPLSDEYIGKGIINKCALDGVYDPDQMPMDEETEADNFYLFDEAVGSEIAVAHARIVRAAGFAGSKLLGQYTSWHGYPQYNAVMSQVNRAAVRTVANFDGMLGMMLPRDTPLASVPRLALEA